MILRCNFQKKIKVTSFNDASELGRSIGIVFSDVQNEIVIIFTIKQI